MSSTQEIVCWLKFTEDKLRSFRIAGISIDLRNICESPIEIELGCELIAQCPPRFHIIPQFKWRRSRMDFAIQDKKKNVRAFIECDGLNFHRTPQQISNDKRKDEAARDAGIRLFRFSSKEIFNDAWGCAARVWEELT